MNAHLSSFVFANKIKRRVKTKTLTIPSCCTLGLHSRNCYQNRWWAFTPPFHLFHLRGSFLSVALSLRLP
ncbi:hypothetical protein Cj8486_0549 [Campylobacter jejuni subsp. jejuni CG8486]|nr:hypothetical protein Cj8486_0549 [Campylobacter jejuni subsp. jejuni CG8486]